MKNARWWLALSMAWLVALVATGAEITAEQAETAVDAWMKKYGAIVGKTVLRIETVTDRATGAQVHVAILRGGGFVVTAADDRVFPVMAYSETGEFVDHPDNPLLQVLLSDASAAQAVFDKERESLEAIEPKGRSQSAAEAVASDERSEAQKEWDNLLAHKKRGTVSKSPSPFSSAKATGSRTETRVKPLLKDKHSGKELLWGQLTHNDQKDFDGGSGLPCYNYYTPEWPIENASENGKKGVETDNVNTNDTPLSTRYPCGCVATAGAMIMKKWEHPSTYSFAIMPANPKEKPTETGREAIGKLTRAIGVQCNATYGPQTEMATETMVNKLVSAFSYRGAFWQDMHDSDFAGTSGSVCNFDKQVMPNLIAGCPVSMKLAGHSVVVDGLQYVGLTRKIHVNFGWLISSANTWYVPQTFHVVYVSYENGQPVTKNVTYNSVKGVGINIHPTKRKAIIAGRVAFYYANDEVGEGLKGASVILKKSGIQVDSGTTDAYGQFSFLVDGGSYELEISKSGYETKTISDITVSCTDQTVANYYQEIRLVPTSATVVATPKVTTTSWNTGEHYVIEMSCATAGATIHYTIDGSEPTEDDAIYKGAFTQYGEGTITLKAKAFKDGMIPSGVCSGDISFRASSGNTQLRSATAIDTASGKIALDNASAGKENGEPVHSVMGKTGGASMWLAFTAPEEGDYTFAASGFLTANEDTSLDTQLAVYAGDSLGALTLVAANDDVDAGEYDLSSRVAFHATKGTTYKIAVDTRNGEKGTIELEWKPGREDVASPEENDAYYTAARNTHSIRVRSTATWHVCDRSDWITVTKSSGTDGESVMFELPEMTEEGTRSGVLVMCAGEDGPCSTIKITQGTTSWATSRAEALAAAKAAGKRVLMVCGRDTCSNTSYTRFTACEDASVKSLLHEGYVLWYCNCDEQWSDYSYYTGGLGSYALPLVCIIDPFRSEEYVTRTTGRLMASTLKQLLEEYSEGSLPTVPAEVSAAGDNAAGTIAISYAPSRRAQSYEIWRGTKWNPAEAVRIASEVTSKEYIDGTAEPSVLYYYRVRAVNGIGASELSAPATGCWRDGGGTGDAAIGLALGAPHLDWTTEGDFPWMVQDTTVYDGAGAVQSGANEPTQGGVMSVLKTTVTGPTRMSFRYKTRMYASRFAVKIDDSEVFCVTGAVGEWALAEVDIPAGRHEIVFSYTKGGYYTSGFNGVYLDAVQFDVLSSPPTLHPATTDDEDTALSFTGELEVSITAPEESVIYYTLDGSEPTRQSARYEGPFTLHTSSIVRAMCIQDGYDCSSPVAGVYLERHPVQAGEWTTDVEGAKKAALKDGTIIVTLLASYGTCGYSRSFKEIAESSEFLAWAKANGVYLITADSSRWVGTGAAYGRFWDLYYDAGQSGSVYYPSLVIANAWAPDFPTGYALARSGQDIGSVRYEGTVASFEAGLKTFFATRPSTQYVWVEFDGHGGMPDEKSRIGIAGQVVGDLPWATWAYHDFDGWYTSADGGEAITEEMILEGDVICHAHWTPYSYQVLFDANGGLVSPTSKSVSYGLAYGELPTPTSTDPHRSFVGWFTALNGGVQITASDIVAITSKQTLYAHWSVAETSETPIAVPHAWLEVSAAELLEKNGRDYEATAKAAAANEMLVWECYLAGLDPTDPGAEFKVKSISFENGKPVVKWAPDLNEEGKTERVYRVWARKSVEKPESANDEGAKDGWRDVTGQEASWVMNGWRVFKVEVDLPLQK